MFDGYVAESVSHFVGLHLGFSSIAITLSAAFSVMAFCCAAPCIESLPSTSFGLRVLFSTNSLDRVFSSAHAACWVGRSLLFLLQLNMRAVLLHLLSGELCTTPLCTC